MITKSNCQRMAEIAVMVLAIITMLIGGALREVSLALSFTLLIIGTLQLFLVARFMK